MRQTTLRPIDQMTRDWEALQRSSASRRAMRLLAEVEPVVARTGADDLGGLVEALRRARGADERRRAAAVLQAMLRSQHLHPLVARAILQAILPGLVTVARRLSWGAGGEWDGGGAFFVDALTTAWEVITEWSGEDRPYAVMDLLSAVRCRLRRQMLRHRSSQAKVVGLDPAISRPALVRGSGIDDLARSIDDLAGRGLDPADAAVLYASRVLGYSLTEIAGMTGRSRRHLGGRRDRAARALIA